jgi:hypothetical protein
VPSALNNQLVSEVIFRITDSCRLHRTTRNPSFEESWVLYRSILVLDRNRGDSRIHTTIQSLLRFGSHFPQW